VMGSISGQRGGLSSSLITGRSPNYLYHELNRRVHLVTVDHLFHLGIKNNVTDNEILGHISSFRTK